MSQPLTDQPLLELIFGVLLPSVGAAVLFNVGASTGGTDIIAMILKKYTSADIGSALFLADFFIAAAAFPPSAPPPDCSPCWVWVPRA